MELLTERELTELRDARAERDALRDRVADLENHAADAHARLDAAIGELVPAMGAAGDEERREVAREVQGILSRAAEESPPPAEGGGDDVTRASG